MPSQARIRPQIRSLNAAQHGSVTHTITPTPDEHPIAQSTLRLRGAPEPPSQSRRIRWAEDVVDNEGMGKKSSKVCCIYHPPRPAGESSSESDSSSSSDEDSDAGDDGEARPTRRGGPDHGHEHGDDCMHDRGKSKAQAKGNAKSNSRKRSPNAYEKMPRGEREMVTIVEKP